MKNYLLLLAPIIFIACKQNVIHNEVAKNPDLEKAKALYNTGNDSAFYYFVQATNKSNDSLDVAISFNYMAVIQSEASDYFGALESLTQSLKYLQEDRKSHRSCLASDYNELGARSNDLQNYKDAIGYFKKAIKFTDRTASIPTIRNNMALSYQKLSEYDEAIQIYQQILKQPVNGPKEYARILSNLAKTKWLKNPAYNATPELFEALNIRRKENDKWGMNASFSHLSDYYTAKAPDTALNYAVKMYQNARELESPDDQLEALQKLIKLGPNKDAKKYFSRYQQLNDSLQTVRNSARNQFALIRFETEEQKADNLLLQKDNQSKTYQLIILISVAMLLFFFGIFWYKKRKQKMALEAQNAIKQSQLKTSKKVHDVVANGLYRVMSELENQERMDKDSMLDRIEDLYEKSRDISYDDPIENTQPPHTRIAELLKSFATEHIHIAIAGNSEALWAPISSTVFNEIEHVLQELMVNMKKHSRADKVGVRFERNQNQLHIFYSDNGVGMPGEIKPNNGLRNTGNRISSIGGTINFGSRADNGLKIEITIPVA